MNQYLNIFIDNEYPSFIDKYLNTKTLNRLKHITQFCGCDYTKLYNPRFLYTRFDHSLVVAHMTWHFTKNKKETIAALLHDIGTPCFAHCIDYVFGDYINQESSEKKLVDIIKIDPKIQQYLQEDDMSLKELEDLSAYHILENKSPQLCTDRLDGVLHTGYIWLQTHSLEQIKEIYNNMIVLQNELGFPEIGFQNLEIAEKFVLMNYIYAKELQGNKDKYVMKYIAEIVKLSVEQNLISLEDLYTKEEKEICSIFKSNFSSWTLFNEAKEIINSKIQPIDSFYISFNTKKRSTIPLVKNGIENVRIIDISDNSNNIYNQLSKYKDSEYAYVKNIKKLRK